LLPSRVTLPVVGRSHSKSPQIARNIYTSSSEIALVASPRVGGPTSESAKLLRLLSHTTGSVTTDALLPNIREANRIVLTFATHCID